MYHYYFKRTCIHIASRSFETSSGIPSGMGGRIPRTTAFAKAKGDISGSRGDRCHITTKTRLSEKMSHAPPSYRCFTCGALGKNCGEFSSMRPRPTRVFTSKSVSPPAATAVSVRVFNILTVDVDADVDFDDGCCIARIPGVLIPAEWHKTSGGINLAVPIFIVPVASIDDPLLTPSSSPIKRVGI